MKSNFHKIRIRYSETDRMGFVYYAHYLVFMETGRTEWLRMLGLSYRELEQAGYFLPVMTVKGKYHRAAKYDDCIIIRTEATELSTRKISFSYTVTRDDELLFEGETVHVFMNTGGRTCSLDSAMYGDLLANASAES